MGTVAVSVRRWRTAAVAGLLCSALLAGCSDDDPEPIVADPPASPSASSSSASASAAPEPWQVRSKAGAVAFVEHWVEVFNEAGRTGRTESLEALSGANCGTCEGAIRLIREWKNEGTVLKSRGWRIVAIQVPSRQRNDPYDVAARIQRSPQILQRADGTSQQFPGSAETYGALVVWRRGEWSLQSLNQVT